MVIMTWLMDGHASMLQKMGGIFWCKRHHGKPPPLKTVTTSLFPRPEGQYLVEVKVLIERHLQQLVAGEQAGPSEIDGHRHVVFQRGVKPAVRCDNGSPLQHKIRRHVSL